MSIINWSLLLLYTLVIQVSASSSKVLFLSISIFTRCDKTLFLFRNQATKIEIFSLGLKDNTDIRGCVTAWLLFYSNYCLIYIMVFQIIQFHNVRSIFCPLRNIHNVKCHSKFSLSDTMFVNWWIGKFNIYTHTVDIIPSANDCS